jgi:hypothetical protein
VQKQAAQTIYRILLLLSSLLAGCASIMNKNLVEVPINTDPPGAKVTVRGHEVTSPGKLYLARGRGNYQVQIEKEGYEPASVELKESWDAWMWGNVVFGGILGLGIDLVSRHGYDLEPEQINEHLTKRLSLGAANDESTRSSEELRAALLDVDRPPLRQLKIRKNVHAVVIGVEQYQFSLPKADFAANDARTTAQYLTNTLRYAEENVAILLNERATKSHIEKYLEGWLPDRVEPGDTVFIYYSGHGASNHKNNKVYLVPYDGDPAFIEQTGYPLDRLYERLSTLPAKDVVVVIDSCFSGAGGRSVIPKGQRPVVISVENPALAAGKIMVLAASSGSQVSSTYEDRHHGLLTYYLLTGLQGEADQNKDNRIDLRELFDYARPLVERTARREFHNQQTPQLLGNPDLLNKGFMLVDSD